MYINLELFSAEITTNKQQDRHLEPKQLGLTVSHSLRAEIGSPGLL